MEKTHNPDVEITVVHRERCDKNALGLYYNSMECKMKKNGNIQDQKCMAE
jgi:hypothetical protein